MQVTCVSQAQLLESSLLEILLNRCIILVLFLRIAKIVALYQVLVQVLGAAGFVKVKGATTCTARPLVCDDLAKGFIGVVISHKMSPNPAAFGTLRGGRRKGIVGHVGTDFRHGEWHRWRQTGQMWAERGFCRFDPVVIFIYYSAHRI